MIIDTVDLHYKQLGSGPSLIILHGIFGSGDNWQTIANAIQQHFTVYLLDLRNHSRSPHTEVFDLDSMADDVLHFMNQHHITSTHLLGHSMGGKVALRVLDKASSRINRTIIVDIAPRAYRAGHHEIFEAMFALQLDQMNNRNDAENAIKKYIPDFGTRQFILKNLHRNVDGKFEWKLNLDSIYRNYHHILSDVVPLDTIHHEILFIKGDRSDYIAEADIYLIKKHYPNAMIQTIAQAGHWVHADNSSAMIESISNYLT